MLAEISELKDRLVIVSEDRSSLEEQVLKLKKRYESVIDENESLLRWRNEAESELSETRQRRQ